jgi:hypothetical protein
VQLQVAVELDPDGDPLGEPGTGAADLDRLDGALDVDRLEVGPVGLDPVLGWKLCLYCVR